MYSKETLIRIVLVAVLLYSALSLLSTRQELTRITAAAADAAQALAALEEENAQLRLALSQGKSDEEMGSLARERLGFVLPGEKIFYFFSGEE